MGRMLRKARLAILALILAAAGTGWTTAHARAAGPSCAAGGACGRDCSKPPVEALAGVWALAVSWQPGFCETFPVEGCPVECAASSAITRFTLHGLWPQDREYCPEGVSRQQVACACAGRRDRLDPVELPDGLAQALSEAMPGTASLLERHEWAKHGTCSGMDQEGYFRTSLDLLDALNRSGLADFVATNAGRDVTFRQFCDAVRDTLGEAATGAVEAESRRVTEGGRPRFYLTELRFWLRPAGGRLALEPENFVPIRAGTRTLGGRADPLCDNHPDRVLYIDRPGNGR
jgi:ribonuclease T2